MAIFKYNNTAQSEIATSDLASGSPTLTVSDGSEFPSEFPYRLSIWNFSVYSSPDDDPNMEIVEVTGGTDNTLTILRAKESTSDVEHLIGHKVAQLITAGTFDRIQEEFDTTNANVTSVTSDLSTHEADLTNPHVVTAAQLGDTAIVAEINSGSEVINDANIASTIARDSEVTADIATHAALTTTHGITGDIVGTTDVQTLEGKTLVTPEVDVINESTLDAGVTVDEVLIKNGTVDGRDVSVDGSKLDGIEPLAKDDQSASEVPFTPSGDISSTDVQNALEELDTEKETPTGAQTKVDTHAALTSTHGVGTIVGKDEALILTNKAIDADNNTIVNIDNDEIKIAAGIVESKLTLDYGTSSLNSSITDIQNDINYPTTVQQKAITDTGEDGGVEGGVFNGDFEYGSGSRTSSGWIGDKGYGWFGLVSVAAMTIAYDSDVSYGGNQSIRLSTTDISGYGYIRTAEGADDYLPLKPSTAYRLSGYIKTNNVATDSAYLRIPLFDTNGAVGTIPLSPKLSGTNDWTYVEVLFTSDSDTALYRIDCYNGVAGNISDAWFDNIKLEQIDTQAVNTQVVTPASVSVEGVTTTDNIDQSQLVITGTTWSFGRTAREIVAQQFTTEEEKLAGVSLYYDSEGGTWTSDIIINIESDTTDEPSGTILASKTLTATEFKTSPPVNIDLPCVLEAGTKYWITATTASIDDVNFPRVKASDGASSYTGGVLKGFASSTWTVIDADIYFKTHFAKHTESPVISANGSSLDLTGVKLLTGATITVNADGSGKFLYENQSGDLRDTLTVFTDVESTDGNRMQFIQGDGKWRLTLSTGYTEELAWKIELPSPITFKSNVSFRIYGIGAVATRVWSLLYSFDNVTWSYLLDNVDDVVSSNELLTIPNSEGASVIYIKAKHESGPAKYANGIMLMGDIDCTNVQLPLFVPSSEVSSETSDLVLNPIDISEGQLWQLEYDLTGWGSRTITMLSDQATYESQVVSANTVYVYDTNGTTPWTWDTRNGLVPPSDRTSGTVMAKFIVGDNQIKTSVNDGSMKANVNLSWDEESLRAAVNRLTELMNTQYPIVVEVDDVPTIDVQLEPTGATANTGYTNDITSLRQTTAGVTAIAYTGLSPRENRFSEWLDVRVECDDGDGVLQGKLYTSDGTLVETYADLMANPILSISNPEYMYDKQRLILQISESTATTSTSWSVTNVKWRYQYNG